MYIKLNDITLYCKKSGVGPPLLLLHGNGEDHHIFDTLSRKLRRHFTLYAVDSRCHGKSGKSDNLSYETMAVDLVELVMALELDQVSVVGFSDGAIIALLLALERPEMIRKMALLGVNLSPADFTDEMLEKLRSVYERKGSPLVRMMLEQPNIPLEAAATVQMPTLLVAAEHDLFHPASFTALAGAMPNARLKIMEGHEHDSYIAGNDLLYEDLVAFLGS